VVIELINVSKFYQSAFQTSTALDNVSIRLTAPFLTALSGPSGCGKSTLMNILAGYDQASAGSYYFAGEKIDGTSIHKLPQKIGMIFQDHGLLDYLKVRDNLLLPGRYNHQHISNQQLNEVAERLQIKQLLDRYPDQLSGGEQQRCGIARVILYQKKVILADEPTGSLDPENRDVIINIFRQLYAEGTSILIATHDQEVADCCGQIITMEHGHVVSA